MEVIHTFLEEKDYHNKAIFMNSEKDESQNKYLHEHFPENLWVSSFMDHAFRCQGLCK